MERNPFKSLRWHQKLLARDYDIGLSLTTLWRRVRESGLRPCRTYPGGKVTDDLQMKRDAFCDKATSISVDDVIAIDETCFYATPISKRGWRKAGGRLSVPLRRTTGKRYSLIVAMRTSGVLHYDLIARSVNTTKFCNFIKSIPTTTCTHILMDNVAFHKSKAVEKQMIHRQLQPLFVSPYSPDWNPAEMLFSLLKRRQLSLIDVNHSDANSVVTSLINSIGQATYLKWFKHCWANMTRRWHP